MVKLKFENIVYKKLKPKGEEKKIIVFKKINESFLLV